MTKTKSLLVLQHKKQFAIRLKANPEQQKYNGVFECLFLYKLRRGLYRRVSTVNQLVKNSHKGKRNLSEIK